MCSEIYSDLDTTVPEFRILELEPALDPGSLIVCRLQKFSFPDAPKYGAISYVWGDPSNKFSILVNDQPFLVTRNLVDILKRLRRQMGSMPLWADAICINQEDIAERNHQVQLMRDIYRSAELVVAWLGEEKDESDLAMDMIENWAKYLTVPIEEVLEKMPNAFDNKAWEAVQCLFKRTYWTRTWVVQEIVFSSEALLMCGSKVMAWRNLRNAIYAWRDLFLPENTGQIGTQGVDLVFGSHYEAASRMTTLHDLVRHKDIAGCDAFRVMAITMGLDATNPRDKTYGLLGFPEIAAIGVDPNYNQPVENVYTGFVRCFIRSERSLEILAVAGIRPAEENSDLELPSWVPDFRHPLGFIQHPGKMFSAADGNTAEVDVSNSPKILKTRVVIFDVVKHYQDLASSEERDAFPTCWRLALSQNSTHPTGIPQFQAFFRTIVLDDSGEGHGRTGFRDDDSRDHFFDLAAGMMAWLGWGVVRESKYGFEWESGDELDSLEDDSDWETVEEFEGELDDDAEAETEEVPKGNYEEDYKKGSNDDPTEELDDFVLEFKKWRHGNGFGCLSASTESILDMFLGESSNNTRLQWPADNNLKRGLKGCNSFLEQLVACKYQAFLISKKGYMARAPKATKPGDFVCVLPGSSVPFILRKDQDHYRLVGECYMYGIMNGEALEEARNGRLEFEDILIR